MTAAGTELPAWAPRQAALLLGILQQVVQAVQQGQAADRALRAAMGDQQKFGSRDRRLLGDAIFAWFRWHGALQEQPMARALCVAWYLDAKPWPPALQAILQDLSLPCPEPLADSLSLAERKTAAEAAFDLTLPEVSTWLPVWAAEELAHLEGYHPLMDFFRRPPAWIRVDQAARPALHEALVADRAVWAGPLTPCAYAFTDNGKVHQWLQQHPDSIEVQDVASQQVVRACAPAAGQSWWDACCGAGGKSLQLLDESGRELDLTCTDRREDVLKELSRRGRRHGLARTRRYALDLLKEPQLPNIPMDGILLDAPCSGQGTWRRNPDAPWRTAAKDVRQIARRQLRMLETVVPALKPGGTLVYAVCSLTRSETFDVVSQFLEAQPGFELSPFPHPLTGELTDGRLALLPEAFNSDGMFIARFRQKS